MKATQSSEAVTAAGPSGGVSDGAKPGRKQGGVPPAVAVGLIVLALAGGGWVVWNFVQGLRESTGSGAVVSVDEKPSEYRQNEWQGRGGGRPMQFRTRQRPVEAGVRARGAGEGSGWEVRAGRSRLIVQKVGGNLRFTADSTDPTVASQEQMQLLRLRVRAATEDAVARQLNLTPEQRKQLAAIPRGANYTIDEATRKSLAELFAAWETAAEGEKAAKSEALVNAVKALEAAQLEPTKASIAKRADEVKAIVTAEQIKLFTDMGRAVPAAPPAAPAPAAPVPAAPK